MMFQDWWIWIGAAVGLGILELFARGFVFLGVAGGALTVGALRALAPDLVAGVVAELIVFAVASVVVWQALRWLSAARPDEPRIWYGDIHED